MIGLKVKLLNECPFTVSMIWRTKFTQCFVAFDVLLLLAVGQSNQAHRKGKRA